MKRLNKFSFVCALGLALLVSSQALATTVPAMDVDDLTDASDAIVLGQVKEVRSALENGRIFTYVTVTIEKTLKGKTSDELVIKHLGGRTDELATYVPGMPHFEANEHTLLFLEQKGETWVTVGLSLGKWAVERNGDEWKAIAPAAVGMRLVPLPSGETKALPESLPVRELEKRLHSDSQQSSEK